MNVCSTDIEFLRVTIKRKYERNLTVSLRYLPPKGNIDAELCILEKLAEAMDTACAEWLIGGDLDINLNTKNKSRAKRLLVNFASRNPLSQLIREDTRINQISLTLINHIYFTNLTKVDCS